MEDVKREENREGALKAILAMAQSFGKSKSPRGLQLLLQAKLAPFGKLPQFDAGQIAKIFMNLNPEERKLARLLLQEVQRVKTKSPKQGRAPISKRLTKHHQSFV